jgi:hypothetical protein
LRESKMKSAVKLSGIVEKVIPSPHPSDPERAQISIEQADDLYEEIRIVNKLTDESGSNVQLTPDEPVEVTIEADHDAVEVKTSAIFNGRSLPTPNVLRSTLILLSERSCQE